MSSCLTLRSRSETRRDSSFSLRRCSSDLMVRWYARLRFSRSDPICLDSSSEMRIAACSWISSSFLVISFSVERDTVARSPDICSFSMMVRFVVISSWLSVSFMRDRFVSLIFSAISFFRRSFSCTARRSRSLTFSSWLRCSSKSVADTWSRPVRMRTLFSRSSCRRSASASNTASLSFSRSSSAAFAAAPVSTLCSNVADSVPSSPSYVATSACSC
mmetsp:Transcript_30422/g.76161  ORF Transcript_30422/g.76161 Transcript_30422/m.76161 type:complete len:217 (+) Transcript_30422:1072-1722(+)